MADYDSILKEEKKYDEEPTKPKKFPWFKIDLLCIILVTIIGYIFYFINILNPRQIFFDDLTKITTRYQDLFTPLLLNNLSSSTNLEGIIQVNDTSYNYNLNKNDINFNTTLKKENEYLIFSQSQNATYLKLSNFKEEYLEFNNINNYPSIIKNIKNNLATYLTEDKFIKRYYLDGSNPIVVSELTLNNEDLKQLSGLTTIKNSYEVLLTLKNHAITNNIISIKATINNKTTNKRVVITYENGILNYKDSNNNLDFKLEKSNSKDFELKIYKEDTLYSVLKGSEEGKKYNYSYKVIDKIYNINLEIAQEKELINYTLNTIVEKNEKTINNTLSLSINTAPSTIGETINIDKSLDFDTLTKEDKELYQTSLDTFLIDFNNFFPNYK